MGREGYCDKYAGDACRTNRNTTHAGAFQGSGVDVPIVRGMYLGRKSPCILTAGGGRLTERCGSGYVMKNCGCCEQRTTMVSC
jgi:hypothetical protein